MYEMAAEECKALLATIAKTCELKRFNVTSQMPPYPGPHQPLAQIRASATYRITPKSN
jgi:hypothetical protein